MSQFSHPSPSFPSRTAALIFNGIVRYRSRVARQLCKTRSNCATNAYVCEVINEGYNLQGWAPWLWCRARNPRSCRLLVAESTGGVSGMADAAGSHGATGATRFYDGALLPMFGCSVLRQEDNKT